MFFRAKSNFNALSFHGWKMTSIKLPAPYEKSSSKSVFFGSGCIVKSVTSGKGRTWQARVSTMDSLMIHDAHVQGFFTVSDPLWLLLKGHASMRKNNSERTITMLCHAFLSRRKLYTRSRLTGRGTLWHFWSKLRFLDILVARNFKSTPSKTVSKNLHLSQSYGHFRNTKST